MTPAAIRKKGRDLLRSLRRHLCTCTGSQARCRKGTDGSLRRPFRRIQSGRGDGGSNGLVFRLMAKRGFSRYRKLGVQSMEIDALEVTVLDGLHAMARVAWDSRARRRSDGRLVRIRFAHHYFLTLARGRPRILAYVATDERAIIEKHGLL